MKKKDVKQNIIVAAIIRADSYNSAVLLLTSMAADLGKNCTFSGNFSSEIGGYNYIVNLEDVVKKEGKE